MIQLLRHCAKFLIHRTRQRYYFNGVQPSHLLAMKLKANERFADVTSVYSDDEVLLVAAQQINDTFC